MLREKDNNRFKNEIFQDIVFKKAKGSSRVIEIQAKDSTYAIGSNRNLKKRN